MKHRLVLTVMFTGLGMSSLFGGQIVQTQSLGTTNLEILGTTGMFTFNDFLNYGVANAILTSVTLELKVGETLVELDVTNSASQPQTFDFVTFSNVLVAGNAPDTGKVKTGIIVNAPGTTGTFTLFDAGSLTYGAGQQRLFVPPTVMMTDDSGAVTAADVAPYDVDGTFNFGFTTATFSGASGSGGNFSFNQATTGTATATVIYNYSIPANTPEPATITLFGSALIGIGLLARRR